MHLHRDHSIPSAELKSTTARYRIAMSLTMDTNYGLPISTHRPSITMDPRDDVPLPFRYELDRATELTADTSTPYILPKPRSRLKALPFDLRLIIWEYVGFDFKAMPRFKSIGGDDWEHLPHMIDVRYTHNGPWRPPVSEINWPAEDTIFSGLMAVNKSIQDELLDLLLRNARIDFRHRLSEHKIFLNPRKNGPLHKQRVRWPT